MAKSKIASRCTDPTQPKRAYRCSGCDAVFKLHPGKHWHTCEGYEWNMHEVKHEQSIERAVKNALAGLIDRTKL